MNLDHVASGRETFIVSLIIGSKYASNKGMPAVLSCCVCKMKTCECCDHVFQFKRKAECKLREKAIVLVC